MIQISNAAGGYYKSSEINIVFDGTDRQSLDDLREAIFKFGEVNDLIAQFFRGEL